MDKIEPRIFKHTILQGEDGWRLAELRDEAARLRPEGSRGDAAGAVLLADDDPWDVYDAACREADDFAAAATERGVTIILRALGRKKWTELVKLHPPVEGDKVDEAVGVDLDKFTEAVILACLSSPALAGEPAQEFLDDLTPADYDALSNGVWNLHKKVGADPKGRLLSVRAES